MTLPYSYAGGKAVEVEEGKVILFGTEVDANAPGPTRNVRWNMNMGKR